MIKRFFPLTLFSAILLFLYFSRSYQVLGFENLRYHYLELAEYANNHPILAPFWLIGAITVSTLFMLPGIETSYAFLSALGGYLFPQPFSTLYVVIGMTLGSTLVFWIVKQACGDCFKKKSPFVYLQKKGGYCLLFLRLLPFIPMWLVNIGIGFFSLSLKTFALITLVGTLPRAFNLTRSGAGLNISLESSQAFCVQNLFDWKIQLFSFGCALLTLIPILRKK